MKNDSRSLVRVTNRQLVLQQLFNHPTTTRVDISRELDINKSTVSAIYNELNDEGFIEELGQGESTNRGGRKPNLVCLDKRYGFVASFEVGTNHLRIMFNYINGEVISYEAVILNNRDMLTIMQLMKDRLQKMEQNNDTRHGLLAIGFSVHGIVDDNQIVDAPFMNTNGIDLATYFENEFNVPTVLENEANLAAIFERDFGDRENYRDLLTISIHKGIGAGIIANHQLYRGFHGRAGEIGRSLVVGQNGELVKVEDLCSEEAILNRIAKEKGLAELTPMQLYELYRQHDEATEKVVAQAMQQLQKTAHNAVVGYGPQAVYFDSPLFDEIPELYQQLRDWLQVHHVDIPIRMIKGSEMASLLGASSIAIHRFLKMDQYSLTLKWPKSVSNIK